MKFLLIALLLLPLFSYSQNVANLQLGEVNGSTFKMSENLNHDATIIIFWATWCVPCKKEFPELQALKEKLTDKDLQIIAISKDSPRSLTKVKNFVKTHTFDFIYLLDPDGLESSKLLVNNVPHTMVVNSEGKVTYNLTGYRQGDEQEIEKALYELWKESTN